MTKQMIRVGVVFTVAVCVLIGRPGFAQTSQSVGWPDKGDSKKAAALPLTPAAVPAPAKVAAPKMRVEAAPASTAPRAGVAIAPAPPAKPVAADPVSAEMVLALQQQAEILNRLAIEIESQRDVMRDQEAKIKALELKAASANATSAPAAVAPVAKAASAPPPPSITVETGGIKLRVSGVVQGWYTVSNGLVPDTFRLRRTELKFSGDMSPRVKWAVMVDPAKTLSLANTSATMGGTTVLTGAAIGQSSRMLQDAFVSLNWKPSVAVEVGQQKIPLSLEGVQSSGKLETVERALFMSDKARGSGYGDVRDLGVMAKGKFAKGQVEYAGGIFNGLGESLNDIDRNEQKAAVGRIVFRPSMIKGLQFGGSAAREEFRLFDITARERQGVEALYTRGPIGIKSELMSGRDAAVTRQGGYFQVTGKVTRPLTMVFRYDAFDPDTRSEKSAVTVTERDWLGGFTYTLGNSGAWLQFNYIRKTFDGVVTPRDVFMTNLQATW